MSGRWCGSRRRPSRRRRDSGNRREKAAGGDEGSSKRAHERLTKVYGSLPANRFTIHPHRRVVHVVFAFHTSRSSSRARRRRRVGRSRASTGTRFTETQSRATLFPRPARTREKTVVEDVEVFAADFWERVDSGLTYWSAGHRADDVADRTTRGRPADCRRRAGLRGQRRAVVPPRRPRASPQAEIRRATTTEARRFVRRRRGRRRGLGRGHGGDARRVDGRWN